MTIGAKVEWSKHDIATALAALGRLKDSADKGSRAFVDDIANNIYHASQKIVPVRTKKLKESGRISRAKTNITHTAAVEYGGLGTTLNKSGHDYAIYVHEIPPNSGGRGNTGNKHEAPRSYKFLDIPAAEEVARADPQLYRHLVTRFEKDWHN